MKKLFLVAGILVLAGGALLVANRAAGGRSIAGPAPRAEGGDVRALVAAVPFELEVPWTHVWRAEQPRVQSGWMLVLEVDPEKVRPTELAQPVLCAGRETVERLNHGHDSGRVVALLPTTAVNSDALVGTPFFFAAPALPESFGARAIERELAAAEARGARSFTPEELAVARARGGAPIYLHDRVELDRLAAQWILEHAPTEHDRAAQMLVPVTR